MFNTQVSSDELVRQSDGSRKLQFEGTVEVEGTFTDQMLNALFGVDSQVNGKLRFEGAVKIDGTFTGSISTDDLLIIGEHAKIAADIKCGSAVVSGEITGNITAEDSVELQPGARVKGDISSPTLAMQKGAMFDGVSSTSSSPARFANLERRGRPARTR
ncbi:MAG: polymer-forming cytoskeletal protein [Chloroflexota bacterium]